MTLASRAVGCQFLLVVVLLLISKLVNNMKSRRGGRGGRGGRRDRGVKERRGGRGYLEEIFVRS